ncbi:MAG: hypothetical protein LBP87_04715 [Planctomycetaceae bacterium]|jgi:hypothetical protein|nr:hypothetical protein [Planctomycetaceae bacterium]
MESNNFNKSKRLLVVSRRLFTEQSQQLMLFPFPCENNDKSASKKPLPTLKLSNKFPIPSGIFTIRLGIFAIPPSGLAIILPQWDIPKIAMGFNPLEH